MEWASLLYVIPEGGFCGEQIAGAFNGSEFGFVAHGRDLWEGFLAAQADAFIGRNAEIRPLRSE